MVTIFSHCTVRVVEMNTSSLIEQVDDLKRDEHDAFFSDACFIALYSLLMLTGFVYLVRSPVSYITWFVSPFIGLFISDALSSILHWSVDTWGSMNTPILGRNIRSFRQHHMYPSLMAHHDFVETNGQNCIAAIPVIAASLLIVENWCSMACILFWTSLAVASTNQIHVWAHRPVDSSLGWMIRLLQRWRIILEPHHHKQHHKTHVVAYGITNGWSDVVLEPIFKRLEPIIAKYLKVDPRSNDEALRAIAHPR